MFQNKQEFKEDYQRRMVESYGRSLKQSHITERYIILGSMIRDYVGVCWKRSKELIASREQKQVFYFSMEFLMGRLLSNNLMNLGIYDMVKDGLDELGIRLHDLEELEMDAALGNGGLGRLAACFLDSIVSLSYPGHGNTIRYEYGLFKQQIVNGYQVEVPDQWLKFSNVWEVKKPKHAVDVTFWGRVEMSKDAQGKIVFHHVDCEHYRAVPYDVPVIGDDTIATNTLRLWSAEASDILPANKDFRNYIFEVNELCQNVYPDDSTERGRYLRLKQEYFFVSAGLQSMIKAHLRTYQNLDNFSDKIVIQLNDTHPVFAIPELMRLLMDVYGYGWDEAWRTTQKTIAYTNHSVMQEVLEKWPVSYVQRLLPRVYMIIEEINRRFLNDLRLMKVDSGTIYQMSIIQDGLIHMANLAVYASFSVNGVSKIHTSILIDDLFSNFYQLYPEKFNNKTNGISHRRWLAYSNNELCDLLNETIGDSYVRNPQDLIRLLDHVEDRAVQDKFFAVKMSRKKKLANYIKQTVKIDVDVNSIFDVQAKRMHAYKRQLLNVLHIIHLYQRLLNDPQFTIYPRTFIFAGKAAPAYYFAKEVIKLINDVAATINRDPRVNGLLKVVFIPNYNVSVAEILLNAADVSEQISTSGKEASGTGNMKFMMNGAMTLGTLDGANVEIDALAKRENTVIFGHTVEELSALRTGGYDAWSYYNTDSDLKKALTALVDGTFNPNTNEFKIVFDELMYKNDEFFVLADFADYVKAQQEIERRYRDRSGWNRTMLINIAQSGHFSSDRTIGEYVDDIWHLEKLVFNEDEPCV